MSTAARRKWYGFIAVVAVILCVGVLLLFVFRRTDTTQGTSPSNGVTQPTTESVPVTTAPPPTEAPPDGTQPSGPSDPTEPSVPDTTEPTTTEPSVTEPTEVPPETTESPTEPSEPVEPTVPVDDDHKHSYTEKSYKATCTEDGYIERVCKCGDSYRIYNEARLGHNYSEWVTTKEPTKEATGERERTCKRCGHVEKDMVAPLDEDGEQYTSYIDPRISILNTEAGTSYNYREAKVSFKDYRTWGETPSIYIENDGSLRVIYFLQNGDMVTQIIAPIEGYYHYGVLYDDGQFLFKKTGKYS